MGTEEFWIPAVLAAVGSGVSAVNQSNANSRANNQATAGIIQQQQLQEKAAGQVNKTVQAIQKSNPNSTTAKSTGDFIKQLRTNQASSFENSGAPPVAGADARYGQDTASGNQTVQDFGNTEANQLGAVTGAVQQRRNEGAATGDLGSQLGLIGAQSGADSFVNGLRTAAAGQQSPWGSLAAGLFGAAGSTLSKNPELNPGSSVYGLHSITPTSKMIPTS